MKFLPMTPLSREVIDFWFQVHNRRRNLEIDHCYRSSRKAIKAKSPKPATDLEDITKDCMESCAPFVCLKIENPCRLLRPVPDKTLIIIALERPHLANGIFHGVDLPSGGSVVINGDNPQYFDGGRRGGGIGVALRLKFVSSQ